MEQSDFLSKLLEGAEKFEDLQIDEKKAEFYLQESKELLKEKISTLTHTSNKSDLFSGLAFGFVSFVFLNHSKAIFTPECSLGKSALILSLLLSFVVVLMILWTAKANEFYEPGNWPNQLISKEKVQNSLAQQIFEEVLSYSKRLEHNEKLIKEVQAILEAKVIIFVISLILFAVYFWRLAPTVVSS